MVQFIKPRWLTHSSPDKKACEVYSVHISADAQRLASGGLDGTVRIWSTEAVFASHGVDDVDMPKQLCALSHHSGAVLAVRFSGNNRFLASGSDDKIVLIYEHDKTAGARPVFGNGESQTEVWRTHRRLAGHDNDVQDLGWSADSSILVSVGLDSKIIVWSGSTFERLKKIDVHQSHVKGIAFDPANKYFATASDDRTVKVHSYTSPASNATANDQAGNFSMAISIDGPFQDSPLTTYFRRCSWSPDGAHIAASNAVNGPVSSVAIITRGSWDSEINLIGHEGPVEVCAFSPRMFTSTNPEKDPPATGTVTVIACAGHDKALSIWNTLNSRPLMIIQNICTKAISDLAWCPDGKSMFVSSLDGLILCVKFDEGDLGWVLPMEENERILQKFGAGRKGATLPEGPDSLKLEELSKASERREVESKMGALMMDGRNGNAPMANTGAAVGPQWQAQQLVAGAAPPAEPMEKEKPYKQKVTFTKDGKKRVAPLLVSTGGSHRSNLPNAQLLQAAATGSTVNLDPKTTLDLSRPYDGFPKGGMAALIIGNKRKQAEGPGDEGQSAPISNGKRVTIIQPSDQKGPSGTPDFIRPAVISQAQAVSQVRLAAPKIRHTISRVIDASGDPSNSIPSVTAAGSGTNIGLAPTDTVFEARNSRDPTRLTISKAGQVLWVDFLPKPVVLVTGNSNFWAAGCEDGIIHIFTPAGRRMLNPLVTEATPCIIDCRGWWLMCVSSVGVAHVWNLKTGKAPHPPVSLAPILDVANIYFKPDGVSRAEAIQEITINSDGVIIVSVTDGDGYAYNRDLFSWQKISESWWAVGSQYWDTTGSVRPSAVAADSLNGEPPVSIGIISHLERRTTAEVLLNPRGRVLQRIIKQCLSREGFEGFETAVSIAHLENRIAAAVMLGAKDEFKSYLMTYVRRLASEGMKGKVEELLRELMGRMDVDEGEEDTDEKDDTVCGCSKRELLKSVLLVVGKHRELQRITVPYAKAIGTLEMEVDEMAKAEL